MVKERQRRGSGEAAERRRKSAGARQRRVTAALLRCRDDRLPETQSQLCEAELRLEGSSTTSRKGRLSGSQNSAFLLAIIAWSARETVQCTRCNMLCCATPCANCDRQQKMASKIFSSPFCSLLSSYSSSPSSPSSPFPISPRPSNIGQNSTAPSAAAAAPSPALPAATSSPNPDAATARCRRHAVAAASPRSSPLPANVAAAAAASPPAASAAASCRQCNFNTRQ